MRENNRKPIEKCRKKLPQFTTMNVIDGQAGLVIYSSLIFYSLTIDNILNIIVLLILAGVSIATLTGQNGILTRANDAKEQNQIGEEKEAIGLAYNGVMADNNGEGVTASQLEDELQNNGYNATAVDNGDGTITVTFGVPSNRVYTIDASGNIEKGTILEGIKPGEIVLKTQKDNYTDIEGNKATVPAGFVVSKIPEEQKVSKGLVIYDIPQEELNSVDWSTKNEDGSYIVQTQYSQFVWIPCTLEEGKGKDIKYDRYAFSRENWANSQTKEEYDISSNSYKIIRADAPAVYDYEELSKIEENSVQTYNGYYIGRYEAGILSGNPRNSSNIEATAEEIEAISGKVIVQKEKYVYDNITIAQAKGLANNMYIDESVESKLCSSYAWDTALKFIEIEDSLYPTNSVGGNYNIGEDINLKKTGYDIRHLCNIYDMGGNAGEFTTEICSSLVNPNVNRGGVWGKSSEEQPAAYRSSASDAHAMTGTTFRVTLYIK